MREWKWPIILFAIVVVIGFLVNFGLTDWFDRPAFSALALREGQSFRLFIWIAKFFTWAGDGPRRIGFTLTFAAWMIWQKRRWAAIAIIVVPALTGVVSSSLKMLFGRARPDLVPHMDYVHDLSFPSGHAASGFATFVLMALLLPAPLQPRFKIPLLALCCGIALSRPMLGVHWPTDILAGGLLGYAAALAGFMAVTDLETQKPKEAP